MVPASHCQRMNMRITLVSFFCSLAFALGAYGQTPTLPPDPAATAAALGSPAAMTVPAAPVAMTPVPVATVAPVVAAVAPSVAPSTPRDADDDEDIDNAIEKKIRKHFNFTFDHDRGGSDSDVPWIAIPIVFIVFLAIL